MYPGNEHVNDNKKNKNDDNMKNWMGHKDDRIDDCH